jgi:hypothetical protein
MDTVLLPWLGTQTSVPSGDTARKRGVLATLTAAVADIELGFAALITLTVFAF